MNSAECHLVLETKKIDPTLSFLIFSDASASDDSKSSKNTQDQKPTTKLSTFLRKPRRAVDPVDAKLVNIYNSIQKGE